MLADEKRKVNADTRIACSYEFAENTMIMFGGKMKKKINH